MGYFLKSTDSEKSGILTAHESLLLLQDVTPSSSITAPSENQPVCDILISEPAQSHGEAAFIERKYVRLNHGICVHMCVYIILHSSDVASGI